MAKKKRNQQTSLDVATKNFQAGYQMVENHPLFYFLLRGASVYRDEQCDYLEAGLAVVYQHGRIDCNPKQRFTPEQWARAIAHCLLHLGMGHFKEQDHPREWNMACDLVVEKFLTDLKFGSPLHEGFLPSGINDEDRLYKRIVEAAKKSAYVNFGTAGDHILDMKMAEHDGWICSFNRPVKWENLFASGLSAAVTSAVSVAAGDQVSLGRDATFVNSQANRAKQWFISSYPLLGTIAANFKLIEDLEVCRRLDITTAAISPSMSEIYINPAFSLTNEEMRFVMAHEFLHAALRHDTRQEWRDAYLWNVACDYVINDWLTDMGVGERPDGLLYDEQFKGLNAEQIYDRIVTDMRTYRKLATLRGVGLGDILGPAERISTHTDLDAFYRRALSQGLIYHQEQGRGYLPESLIEEIRALSHPPIPWDVRLARWFEEQFMPLEKVRSYARLSRRQSATPDIPRPSWKLSEEALDGRTFGVILDTSGSMSRYLLATALGAIASYSVMRDISAVRVVFCDAAAYDAGYMQPSDIAGRVKVKGRGGTILQPGIDLLSKAEDFPKDAPLLIITDAECDRVMLYGREHAFLIPYGANLPFVAKGKVFRMR